MKNQIIGIILLYFPIALFSQVQDSSSIITIARENKPSVSLDFSELKKIPFVSVKASGHDKVEHDYEGVELWRLLSLVGYQFGDSLKGKLYASSILTVKAIDGYQTIFTLIELDPTFSDKKYILAYSCDQKKLDSKDGFYQIIIPGEKRHARWIRQVRSMEIRQIR